MECNTWRGVLSFVAEQGSEQSADLKGQTIAMQGGTLLEAAFQTFPCPGGMYIGSQERAKQQAFITLKTNSSNLPLVHDFLRASIRVTGDLPLFPAANSIPTIEMVSFVGGRDEGRGPIAP